MISYTGIGSRSTPVEFLDYFKELGSYLAQIGLTLRSGGADGADSSFENGCDLECGSKEIFLPWRRFNGNQSSLYDIPDKAFDISSKFHPNWFGLKDSVKRLHARNAQQVLGPNLDDPVKFVICWTNPAQGGTNQALRIACHYKIPIYNYWIQDDYEIQDVLNECDI